jgi:predicted nucleic acid-binding protein
MATYLADKSALIHMRTPEVAARLAPLIQDGEVATCGVVELEVLYSARSEADLIATRSRRAAAFPRIAMSEEDFHRAEDVMADLASKGHHRGVSLPDLLIAAVAERSRLIVLHYDADYDLIATVTGQEVEWVAPRGSLR